MRKVVGDFDIDNGRVGNYISAKHMHDGLVSHRAAALDLGPGPPLLSREY
jgi:hypothetical protein